MNDNRYDDEYEYPGKPSRRIWYVLGGLVIAIGLIAYFLHSTASAHDAPTGWTFDPACCGGNDCHPVPESEITVTPQGYHIGTTNETIPYQSTKVRPSPDGHPYRCSVGGKPTGNTYCIYVSKGGV